MLRDAGKHASPNAGWPEAAMAGALGVQLGGVAWYDGVTSERPTMGDGPRRGRPIWTAPCGSTFSPAGSSG
jgi:adenosylcobinamide-phosphate synthase